MAGFEELYSACVIRCIRWHSSSRSLCNISFVAISIPRLRNDSGKQEIHGVER